MNDLTTVMWKEWRELRAQSSNVGRGSIVPITIVMLIVVALISAVAGVEMIRTPFLLVMCMTPILAVLSSVCEAFAGERERHTLETLLASRVTSEALLVGKLAVNVLYAWGAAVVLFVIFVVSANVPTITRGFVLPRIETTLAIFILMPLLLLFFCTAGLLLSMRSPTVRQAQTKLTMLFMGSMFAFVIPFLVIRSFVPELFEKARQMAARPNAALVSLLIWCLILVVADVAMLLIARWRFQRSRLIEIR